MRYRNKYNINFSANPLKKDPALLSRKNALEAEWYDAEAVEYFAQLDEPHDGLIQMDREYEDWFGAFYDSPSDRFAYDRLFVFFDLFPRARPLRLLDLGCGPGPLSRFFLRRGVETTSVDVSSLACRFVAKSSRDTMPLRACAEILPFKAESFDVVTSFVSLHHFNLSLSLREMRRILRPGGMGIFVEPLCNSATYYKIRQLVPLPDNESPGGGGLNRTELEAQLKAVGFTYWIKEFELITRLERLPGLTLLQDRMRKIDHFLLYRLPLLRHFARSVVMRFER